MRLIPTFFLILNLSFLSLAQEIIKKKDGTIINVKLIKIAESYVDYKVINETGTLLFSVSKTDLVSIQYQDGSILYFREPLTMDEDHRSNGNLKTTVKNEATEKRRFYLSISYGETYPLFKDYFGTNSHVENINNHTTYTEDNVYGTLGKGWNWNAGCGLMFREKIGLQIRYTNFSGKELELKNYHLTVDTAGKSYYSNEIESNAQKNANYKAISMDIILKQKWFYTKIGFIGSMVTTYVDSSYKTFNNIAPSKNRNRQSLSKLTGPIQFGLTCGAGILLPLGKNLAWFSELNTSILSLHPTKQKFIKVTENEKEERKPEDINFGDTSTNLNRNQKTQKPISLNSWGWNVGLRILF